MTGPQSQSQPWQPSSSQRAILAAAFGLLLDPGDPVSVSSVAEATGLDAELVEAGLADLAGGGRIQREADGSVRGCLGLTLDTTHHAMSVDGTLRHTWCALDAFGIMAALNATGWIDSTNRMTDRSFHVDVREGEPQGVDESWVVFILERGPVSSLIAEWCPLVNIFESAEAARTWADTHDVPGQTLSVAETAALGRALWEPRVTLSTGP